MNSPFLESTLVDRTIKVYHSKPNVSIGSLNYLLWLKWIIVVVGLCGLLVYA